MRTKGSARFDPYYKVQWYDEHAMAWRDIQHAYSTQDEAEAAYVPNHTCRLMLITMHGRSPVPRAA
jgi:hypothetical protein